MKRLIPVLWLMLAAVIIGGSIGMAARAGANPVECHTTPMSGVTYEYCYYTDDNGYRYGIETICHPNGYCTTWDM